LNTKINKYFIGLSALLVKLKQIFYAHIAIKLVSTVQIEMYRKLLIRHWKNAKNVEWIGKKQQQSKSGTNSHAKNAALTVGNSGNVCITWEPNYKKQKQKLKPQT